MLRFFYSVILRAIDAKEQKTRNQFGWGIQGAE
jgi:hypothetical protein